LSQNFLEWYWNPGDWVPAKQAFLPRPWGLRLLNPLTNPVDGAFGKNGGVCGSAPGGTCTRLATGDELDYRSDLHVDPTELGTKLFTRGDWTHFDPKTNSQVGVRLHSIMPFGMEMTLAYFYQRFAGDDGTNFAQLQGIELPNTTAARNKAVARS